MNEDEATWLKQATDERVWMKLTPEQREALTTGLTREAFAEGYAGGRKHVGVLPSPSRDAAKARLEVAALGKTVAGLEGTVDEVKATLFRFLDAVHALWQRVEALERRER